MARRSPPGEESETLSRAEVSESGTAPLDAVVVGAGVIGLSCAWRAAQRGLRVRVLERDEPGAGASGVAAGMLAPVGESSWGEEALLGAAHASHAAWPGFAAELAAASGLDTGYLAGGALHVALDGDEAAELRRRFDLMGSLGLDARWLAARRCRELEPGLAPSVFGGVHAPHEAGVDPRALIDALRVACELAGVEIAGGVEAIGPVLEGKRLCGVLGSDGSHNEAPATVVAAGAWSGDLGWLPAIARPPVRPVKGQILTLRGPGGRPAAEHIIVTERVYLVPRSNGRLVVGATVEELGFDTRVTAGGVHELLREAYRALPDVAELELERAVSGLRPATKDNAPLVGAGAVEGLLLATGHFRNGILLAPLTATAIAGLLCGEELLPELRVADPLRFAERTRVRR